LRSSTALETFSKSPAEAIDVNDTVQPSTFVTVLGWLVAIFAGFSLLASVAQTALLGIMPFSPLTEGDAAEMPAIMKFLFNNFQLIVYGSTAVYALVLSSAIGLIKRKEWGRITMMAMFALNAVFIIALAILQFTMMSQFFDMRDAPADAKSFMSVVKAVVGGFTLLLVAIHAWIVIRLNSPAVRAEFR
jgi:hypothetical protein